MAKFSAGFFQKLFKALLQPCRFRFAGAKLLPLHDMAKCFRKFFQEKLQHFRQAAEKQHYMKC